MLAVYWPGSLGIVVPRFSLVVLFTYVMFPFVAPVSVLKGA